MDVNYFASMIGATDFIFFFCIGIVFKHPFERNFHPGVLIIALSVLTVTILDARVTDNPFLLIALCRVSGCLFGACIRHLWLLCRKRP
jgi:hypothetical protein